MENEDYNKLTEDQINDITNWFKTVKGIHQYKYLNEKTLKNILSKNITIDKNGKYKYNSCLTFLSEDEDKEQEKLINKILHNWSESNSRISEYAKLSTLERVKYLRDNLNIPE